MWVISTVKTNSLQLTLMDPEALCSGKNSNSSNFIIPLPSRSGSVGETVLCSVGPFTPESRKGGLHFCYIADI